MLSPISQSEVQQKILIKKILRMKREKTSRRLTSSSPKIELTVGRGMEWYVLMDNEGVISYQVIVGGLLGAKIFIFLCICACLLFGGG